MVDERIRALETKVAVQEARLQTLEPILNDLVKVTNELRSAIDRGRGAIWIMLILGTGVGVIGTWLADYFKH